MENIHTGLNITNSHHLVWMAAYQFFLSDTYRFSVHLNNQAVSNILVFMFNLTIY